MPVNVDRPPASLTQVSLPPSQTRTHTALWLAGILGLAAFLRLFHPMSLFPVLVDESIYIRWAEIIDHQGQWFISLLDAKQPFSYWIYAIVRKSFPTLDPLLGARLVSVAAGLGSTALLFRMARRLGGSGFTGLIAALLYAAMPFGVLYDRLAYTDALVNLCGIAAAAAALEYFAPPSRRTVRGALLLGLLLGVGFGVKSTFALFMWGPAAAAILFPQQGWRTNAIRLTQIYSAALVLPAICFLNVPAAPVFEVNNLLFHHTSFFPPLDQLAAHPFMDLPQNLTLFAGYARCYITIPFLVAGAASSVYLLYRKRRDALFLTLLVLLPLAFEVFALWMMHSRYLFPLMWPLAPLTALALTLINRRVALLAAAAIVLPLLFASAVIITTPARQLHFIDVDEFLSSGPYSGYGVAEAVSYLKKQASNGPLTLLTDPRYGTPADAFYAYLNLWHGVHVYDAWWMQLSDSSPILPKTPMEVMKSQYERVSAGSVDFPSLPRVYYVTDTNYNLPADTAKRQPGIKPEVRFMKRNGVDSIDLYRLR